MSQLASEVTGAATGPGSSGGGGLISKMMASPYTAPAMVMSGSQLVGGLMQGYGAQQQQNRQEELAADARQRYNDNVGALLYPQTRRA